jgi:hypothetical protein
MKLTVFVSKLELETALRKERSKRMERSSLVNKNQKPKKKKKKNREKAQNKFLNWEKEGLLCLTSLKDHGFLILVAPLARNFLKYRYLELEN